MPCTVFMWLQAGWGPSAALNAQNSVLHAPRWTGIGADAGGTSPRAHASNGYRSDQRPVWNCKGGQVGAKATSEAMYE